MNTEGIKIIRKVTETSLSPDDDNKSKDAKLIQIANGSRVKFSRTRSSRLVQQILAMFVPNPPVNRPQIISPAQMVRNILGANINNHNYFF